MARPPHYPTFKKDQHAVLDYTVDWKDWIGTDTIATSTWTVPAGITKDSDSHGDVTAVIWLSGGTPDTAHEIVNHIVTAAGREDDRTIRILVVDK